MPLVKVRMGQKTLLSKNVAAVTKKDKVQDKEISRLKRKVKAIAPEVKTLDNSFGLTPDYTTGTVSALNNPAQGNTDSTREGDVISNIGFSFDGTVEKTGTAINQSVSIMIIKWMPNNVPTLPNIVQTLTTQQTAFSAKFYDNRKLFKVVWHRIFDLDQYHPRQKFHLFKRLKSKTNFLSASQTYSNNGYYLVTYTGNSNIDPPVVYGYMRWYFTG